MIGRLGRTGQNGPDQPLRNSEMICRMSFWQERLRPDERPALLPGLPADLRHDPDVLVVGGGAIGLAVAAACVRAGLGHVVVLERESRLASAASGANGGAIAPDMHLLTDSAEFVAFGRTSRRLYQELDAEWNGAIGLWPTRWLNIFAPDQAPEVSRQTPGPAVPDRPVPPEFRMLDAAEVSELEPDVRLPEGGTAMLVDGQFGVNPQRLVSAFAARAGQVATGVAMRDVTIHGDRIVAVHTTAGDFTPGALVVATGLIPVPWSAGVPQRWIKGHMAAVGPGEWELGSVLAGPLGGGTPLPDGTIFAGGTFDPGDHTPEVRPEVAAGLVEALATLVPAAAGAPIADRWCCFRPYIEGRQPVIDRLPGVANGWFAGGHFTTGIMMAAATGAAVAGWIGEGVPPPGIETFTMP
jgi:glycine/D-amino acid oxidase-like deaminating enzyme